MGVGVGKPHSHLSLGLKKEGKEGREKFQTMEPPGQGERGGPCGVPPSRCCPFLKAGAWTSTPHPVCSSSSSCAAHSLLAETACMSPENSRSPVKPWLLFENLGFRHNGQRAFLGSKTPGKSHSCFPEFLLPSSPHKPYVFEFLILYFSPGKYIL